jgi:hypothetical protein
VLFVRPQVELLLPTCFQWTIFDDTSDVERGAINKVKQISKYSKQLEALKSLGVSRTHVALAKNTPMQFAQIIGLVGMLQTRSGEQVNRQFTPHLVHVLLYFKELVRNPHDQRFRDFLRKGRLWRRNRFTKLEVVFSEKARLETLKFFEEENAKLFDALIQSDVDEFRKREETALVKSGVELVEEFTLRAKKIRPKSVFLIALILDTLFWQFISFFMQKLKFPTVFRPNNGGSLRE